MDRATRAAYAAPCAAARASAPPAARAPRGSGAGTPAGRQSRCRSARSTRRSCRARLVQHELEHRHGAVARGDEIAREQPQLAKAPRVEALEENVVDAPLIRRQALEERARLAVALEEHAAAVRRVGGLLEDAACHELVRLD